jgi:hypothetical protein
MKTTPNNALGKKWRAILAMPAVQYPTREEFDDALANCRCTPPGVAGAAPIDAGPEKDPALPKALANIATNVWKARNRLVDAQGEPREETKRVFRHIESIQDSLAQLRVEIRDHTGEVFNYGLPLTVITTQPTKGINRERVIETIKPTVYWNRQMIQAGEVVVATPA